MMMYRCDGCGVELKAHALRYTVSIDVRAAYDELIVSLADLIRDHRAEILALIERMKSCDVQDLEDQVYKKITLDLCPACQKAFIRNPLQFRPERSRPSPVDVDTFLRSLGFGEPRSED